MNPQEPVLFELPEEAFSTEAEVLLLWTLSLIPYLLIRLGRRGLIAIGPHVPWRRLRAWLPVVMPLCMAVAFQYDSLPTLVLAIVNLPLIAILAMLPWDSLLFRGLVAWLYWRLLILWLEDLSHANGPQSLQLHGESRAPARRA